MPQRLFIKTYSVDQSKRIRLYAPFEGRIWASCGMWHQPKVHTTEHSQYHGHDEEEDSE